MTIVYSRVAEFRAACDAVRARGETLGFVPTMGALHAGHLTLMRAARRRADHVAVSIFVNPTQFGPNEDFARYPRDFGGDFDKCRSAGVELVFAPEATEIYPPGETTRVSVGELGRHLCGASRPGHFDGVATVVTKLFALSGPCSAVFGRKDYQQLKIIERLVRDLLLPATVVGHPTVRENDGLALSSRNRYLSAEERQRALAIPRGLSRAHAAFAAGERAAASIRGLVEQELLAAELRIDYLSVADPDALSTLDGKLPERALIALAVHCGTTRLIDNLVLGEDAPP